MKLKLYHILLITLPLYGSIISIATSIHNSMVYESALYLLNPLVESVVVPVAAIPFSGINLPSTYHIYLVSIVKIIANLLFWIPVVMIANIVFKSKNKVDVKNEN